MFPRLSAHLWKKQLYDSGYGINYFKFLLMSKQIGCSRENCKKSIRKRGKCTMTITQQIITIAVVVLGTMTTRFLPFVIFSADSTPDFVRFLGRVLPNAVIGLLVIYSLKDSIGGTNHCIPELIALAFIFILHKWRKNTLLSIAGGTILYMFLIQTVF